MFVRNKIYYRSAMILLLSLVFLLSVWQQSHFFLCANNCWLLHCAKALLSGGTYTHDFLETNPPLIIFIYVIPVFFSNIFHFNLILSFYAFVYVLGFISLFLSAVLSIPLRHCSSYFFSLFVLSIFFFIAPTAGFGEREHIIFMLLMPYVFLIWRRSRLDHISGGLALVVGLLAAVGFSIKPYFLIVFVFLEIVLFCYIQKLRCFFRIEVAALYSFILLYLLSIWLITPDFYRFVLPMLLVLYPYFERSPVYDLFFLIPSFIFILASIVAMACLPYVRERSLIVFVMAAAVGSSLVFLWEGTLWNYHTFPMLFFVLYAFLMSTYLYFRKLLLSSDFYSVAPPLIVVAPLLLSIVYCVFAFNYSYYKYSTSPGVAKVVGFLKNYAISGRYYFLNMTTPSGLFIPYYSGRKSASRFMQLWPMPGLEYLKNSSSKLHRSQYSYYATLLRNAVTDDFLKYHPRIVLVETAVFLGINSKVDFRYIPFFEVDPRFKQLWKQYHFDRQIAQYRVYLRGSG